MRYKRGTWRDGGEGEEGDDLWEIGRRWMEVKWPARSVKR